MTTREPTTRDYERAAAETIVHLPKLIAEEFGCSSSEARRLIAQGAVKLDGCVARQLSQKARGRMTEERTERTLRHPENGHFCGCLRSCMLTKAECHRNRVKCRYRGYEVKPLDKLLPPSLRTERPA